MNSINIAVEAHLHILSALKTPKHKGLFIYSVLANVLGNLDEKEFSEMEISAAKPCGELNCDCHLILVKAFETFRLIRKDWFIETHERRSARKNAGFGIS